jgi:hypothetical protein
MNADDLVNTANFQTVNPPPDTTAQNVMAGLNAGVQEQKAQKTEQQLQIEKDMEYRKDAEMLQGVNKDETIYDTSVQGYKDLYEKQAESKKALAEAYKTGGVPEMDKRLAELKHMGAQFQGSYLEGVGQLSKSGYSKSFGMGLESKMYKDYALKASAVALEQQALQGNIENAKANAKEMVDLEFGDLENQIAYQKDLINLNYDNLTRTEKKRADELNYILDQRQARVDEEKLEKTKGQELLITAISKGAPPAVQNAIKNAKTFEEKALAAGDYLSSADNKVDFGVIGQTTDEWGNAKNVYGFINKTDQTVTNLGGNTVNYDDKGRNYTAFQVLALKSKILLYL